MNGEKKKFKAPPPVADINVTPMVDVMLVMLIIFMVITPMLSKGVTVELVRTSHPIAMQAADKSDLPNKVKDLLANRLDKTVFVKADARARYERVVDVVDNLRAAGVDQLGLLTDQKEPGKMENGAADAAATPAPAK